MSIGEGRINTKFKQTAAKIKISSDLLENVCKSINVLHFLRFPKSSSNYRFSTGIEFFLIAILEKDSILDFCQGSEYGNG